MSAFLSNDSSDWSDHYTSSILACSWSSKHDDDSHQYYTPSLFSSPEHLSEPIGEDPFINSATCSPFDTNTPKKTVTADTETNTALVQQLPHSK